MLLPLMLGLRQPLSKLSQSSVRRAFQERTASYTQEASRGAHTGDIDTSGREFQSSGTCDNRCLFAMRHNMQQIGRQRLQMSV